MGFGIMFLGYFAGFVMFLGRLAILRFISSIVMGYAALKLRKYNRYFNLMMIACLVSSLFYGAVSVFDLIEYFSSVQIGGEILRTVFAVIDIPFTFAFHVCMLLGIRAIAKDTETPKILFASTRNLIFYCILLVLQLVTLLPYTVARNLSVLAVICSLVLAIFDLLLIFRCYAQICDPEDIDMERKPSRFAFINKFREEAELRQKRADEERVTPQNRRGRRKKK